MGDGVATEEQQVRPARALLARLLSLPAGLHTVTIVKTEAGAAGLVGWVVDTQRLETPKTEV